MNMQQTDIREMISGLGPRSGRIRLAAQQVRGNGSVTNTGRARRDCKDSF